MSLRIRFTLAVASGCCGRASGSGLTGLKDRVEAIGGRILLRSPPGAGTTLEIALPLGED